MKSKIKITSKLATLFLLMSPIVVLADELHVDESDKFIHDISLWGAIVVGFIATAMVLNYARKIGGGVLQKVYCHFGFGMLFVVLGFLVMVLPAWSITAKIHDVFFALGMIIMAIGARKLLKAAQ